MLFYLQIAISFVVGGITIALQSLIGERTRGFWRNVVLTCPTTMALGLLFIGLTKTPADVVHASLMLPAGLAPDYIFVVLFAILAQFNFSAAIIGGFLSWAIGAAILILYPPANYIVSIFLYCAPIILATYIIINKLPQIPHLKPFPMNARNVLIRALIGGSVIALVVLLAKTLGNIWGGLFTVFPASYTSTLSIYYYTQGKTVIPSVAKSLFFPGIVGFIIYGWIAAVSFPIYGIWLGTLAAYSATFVWYGLYYLTQKKLAPRV